MLRTLRPGFAGRGPEGAVQGAARRRAGQARPESGSRVTEPNAELARRVLAALSHGDVQAFAELVHPEIEIRTARGVWRGREEAEEWAQKGYEHLERRYA